MRLVTKFSLEREEYERVFKQATLLKVVFPKKRAWVLHTKSIVRVLYAIIPRNENWQILAQMDRSGGILSKLKLF